MKKKMLLLVVIIALLSACAPQSVKTVEVIKTQEVVKTVEVVTTQEVIKTVEVEKEVDKSPINVTIPWTGDAMELFMPVVDAFEAKTGIKVRVLPYKTENLGPLLPAQFMAKEPMADVMIMSWPWWIEQNSEHLLDLSDLTEGIDFLGNPVVVDGAVYGVPSYLWVKPGFWYRKSVFQANGLEEPQTWDEFLALMDKIKEIVGPFPSEYSEKKLSLRKSVGYEDINAQVRARIIIPPEYRGRHPDELLVDLILGLVPEVRLAGGEIQDVRFGISSKSSKPIDPGVILKISGKPVTSGTLRLRNRARTREVSLPVEVFLPRGIRYRTAPGAHKVLLRLPYAQLVLPANKGDWSFHFTIPREDETFSLAEVANLARVLIFTYDTTGSDEERTIDVWLDESKIGVAEFGKVSLPKESIEWANLVLLAQQVAVRLSLPSDLRTTFKSLLAQRSALTVIHAASGLIPSDLTFTFSVKKKAKPSLGEQVCFPIPAEIELGNSRTVVFVSLLGTIDKELENGEYIVPVKRALIERILRLGPGESLPKKRELYLNDIAQVRAEECGVVCWWGTKDDIRYLGI